MLKIFLYFIKKIIFRSLLFPFHPNSQTKPNGIFSNQWSFQKEVWEPNPTFLTTTSTKQSTLTSSFALRRDISFHQENEEWKPWILPLIRKETNKLPQLTIRISLQNLKSPISSLHLHFARKTRLTNRKSLTPSPLLLLGLQTSSYLNSWNLRISFHLSLKNILCNLTIFFQTIIAIFKKAK